MTDAHAIARRYRTELLDSVVPFWLRHSLDRDCGGYYNCLDRDGTVWDTDKYLWMQGRELWMWSTLCQRLERRPEWEAAARHGAAFLRGRCLNEAGRVHFAVNRAGEPLLKPRDIFAESFVAIGMAAYGALTGERWASDLAWHCYQTYLDRADRDDTHDGSQYPGARIGSSRPRTSSKRLWLRAGIRSTVACCISSNTIARRIGSWNGT